MDLPKEAPLTEWGIAKNLPSIFLGKSKLGFAAVGVSAVAPTAQTSQDCRIGSLHILVPRSETLSCPTRLRRLTDRLSVNRNSISSSIVLGCGLTMRLPSRVDQPPARATRERYPRGWVVNGMVKGVERDAFDR